MLLTPVATVDHFGAPTARGKGCRKRKLTQKQAEAVDSAQLLDTDDELEGVDTGVGSRKGGRAKS
jgi:hypothetical protein